MPYEPRDPSGALTDAEPATFLAEPWNGRIATITPEGWPYVAPVWYEFERDRRSVRLAAAVAKSFSGGDAAQSRSSVSVTYSGPCLAIYSRRAWL
jgi:Pyridoxamine 5'-phosphate oxidase